jgi:hypothetical protein
LSTKLKEYEDEIEKLIQTKENLELEITEQMLGREETVFNCIFFSYTRRMKEKKISKSLNLSKRNMKRN